MKEWLAGSVALMVANLLWETLLLLGADAFGVGGAGLAVRTLFMVSAFGIWTMARRQWL